MSRGINSQQWRAAKAALRELYKGRCAYCAVHVGKRGTVDHYVPRSAGGGNELANLRWCCLACNTAKADMTPVAWELMPRRVVASRPSRREVRRQLLELIARRGRGMA